MMPLLLFLSLAGNVRLDITSSNTPFAASYGSLSSSSQATNANLMTAAVMIFLLVLSFTRFKAVLVQCVRNPALTGLGLLALGSSLWSQYPARSICYGALILVNIMFAFFVTERFTPESRMRLLMIVGWIVVLASIGAALIFPGYGLDHRGVQDSAGAWVGIFRHKNWCAIMVAFLLSPALYLPVRSTIEKIEKASFVVLSLFLIYQTQSRTGWVVTIAMLSFFLCEKIVAAFSRRDRFAILAVGTALIIIICVLLWQFKGIIFIVMGRDSSLTGRTGIWQLVFRSVMKHPLLGYGYNAFWNGLQGESANVSLADHWIVPAAHNGFLDLWLELGAVGLLLFAAAVIKAVWEGIPILHRSKHRSVAWCLCVVFTTIAANVAEGTIMFPNHLAWIIFVIACVGLREHTFRSPLEEQYEKDSSPVACASS